jgi:hypothetical protein
MRHRAIDKGDILGLMPFGNSTVHLVKELRTAADLRDRVGLHGPWPLGDGLTHGPWIGARARGPVSERDAELGAQHRDAE